MKLNNFLKFNSSMALAIVSCVLLSGCGKDHLDNHKVSDFQDINISEMKQEKPQKEEVSISIIEKGRKNPFRSYQEKNLVLGNDPVLGKIPKPPQLNSNSDIDSLLSIKITGILYDNKKPSALVYINDEEYLVHKNDNIFDFKIHDITPENVVISKGLNVYKAGIGEIIDGVETGSSEDIDPNSLPNPEIINYNAHFSAIVDNKEETIVIK